MAKGRDEEHQTASQFDKEPLTVREAAEELGISDSLVRNLIHSGQLAAYCYSKRKTVIYRDDLNAFKESRRIEPPNQREAG